MIAFTVLVESSKNTESVFRPVRFTPNSGHVHCSSRCLLWANSGHYVSLFDDLIGAGELGVLGQLFHTLSRGGIESNARIKAEFASCLLR